MPTLKSADLEMHYEVDDFTDPWTTPETILMLHGNSESGLAWYGWVPLLARKYRDAATTRQEKARRMRFLQSRGFSFDTIRGALAVGEEDVRS